MHSKIVLTLGCPGDIALAYHLEVHLHYLFNVSESWWIALQHIGIMGEWLQHADLPGFTDTHAQHVRGEISQVDVDLVSSDDSNSGSEVESVANEDDNVDDLIDNLSRDCEAETSEGDMNAESHYSLISDNGRSSISHSRGVLTRRTDHPHIPTSFPLPTGLLGSTFGKSWVQDDGVREAERQCGMYWCTGSDVLSVVEPTSWINGWAITRYAEAVARECGNIWLADHLPAQVLISIREYLSTVTSGDITTQVKRVHALAHDVAQVCFTLARKPMN